MWLDDTIEAIASAAGASERAVVRVSGPAAFEALAGIAPHWHGRRERSAASCTLELPLEAPSEGVSEGPAVATLPLDALVLTMPGPRSFTGEDCVELHVPGGALLVERVRRALRPFARPARPGEFTRRAVENGRIDLAAAEGLHALIRAEDDIARRAGLRLLQAGGRTARAVLDRIDDALAEVEASLDFDQIELEMGAVDGGGSAPLSSSLSRSIERALEATGKMLDGLPAIEAGAAGDVVLVGRVNAGKSSLCNALARLEADRPGNSSGRQLAVFQQLLVSPTPGTTRDLVEGVVLGGGVAVLDSPGIGFLAEGDAREKAADEAGVALRDQWLQQHEASVVHVRSAVDEGGEELSAPAARRLAAVVWTKIDLRAAGRRAGRAGGGADVPSFEVSSVTGQGLEALRAWLAERPRVGSAAAPAAALRAAGEEALSRLQDAANALEHGAPAEVVTEDLRRARGALAEFAGATRRVDEAVLDRVFASFCLGK